MFNIGDRVIANKMASDSFYKSVIGNVIGIKNGYVKIEADTVMTKWDNEFSKHPGTCSTSAKLADCSLVNAS